MVQSHVPSAVTMMIVASSFITWICGTMWAYDTCPSFMIYNDHSAYFMPSHSYHQSSILIYDLAILRSWNKAWWRFAISDCFSLLNFYAQAIFQCKHTWDIPWNKLLQKLLLCFILYTEWFHKKWVAMWSLSENLIINTMGRTVFWM